MHALRFAFAGGRQDAKTRAQLQMEQRDGGQE